MIGGRIPGIVAILVGIAAASCVEAGPEGGWDGEGMLAIEGATVFTAPGVDPIQDGVVIVVDGVVEAVGPRPLVPIPPQSLRVDGTGLSVLAGFWNVHVRMEPDLLELAGDGAADELAALLADRFTRFGFTSVVETATSPEALAPLLDRIASGEVRGPRVIAGGEEGLPPIHLPWPEGPPWTSELMAELAEGGVRLVPALAFLTDGPSDLDPDDPDAGLDRALERLEDFVGSGGRLLFGTGSGYVPHYDPTMDHLLLEEAGIPFDARLAALTTAPALDFGFLYLGEVEPGMVADLVLLEGDPEVDATAFERVRWVLRDGRPVYP